MGYVITKKGKETDLFFRTEEEAKSYLKKNNKVDFSYKKVFLYPR